MTNTWASPGPMAIRHSGPAAVLSIASVVPSIRLTQIA